MSLKNTIKKVLSEELINFDKYSKLEKGVKKLVDNQVAEYSSDLSENYYGVVVDIYDSNYGKICYVTFLYKNPFKEDDVLSYDAGLPKKIKKDIKGLFTDFFGNISVSRSTIDSYLPHKIWYDSQKHKSKD
jgi:hypothetical protein